MENNNNNGRGIFYGVIGVATLIVAIIGATFAYFSASVSANNIVNVGSTTLTLNIIDEAWNIRTDMIPVDVIKADGNFNEDFATVPGMGTDKCEDLVGNGVCSMYEFGIENPSSTTAQTVLGSFKVTNNTGFENLYYALFKGRASQNQITDYDVLNNPVKTVTLNGVTQTPAANGSLIVSKTVIGDAGSSSDDVTADKALWANTTERLDPGAKTYYTMVIWLEETGINQDEMGKLFSGGITFTSDTGNGVTGILSTTTANT